MGPAKCQLVSCSIGGDFFLLVRFWIIPGIPPVLESSCFLDLILREARGTTEPDVPAVIARGRKECSVKDLMRLSA